MLRKANILYGVYTVDELTVRQTVVTIDLTLLGARGRKRQLRGGL